MPAFFIHGVPDTHRLWDAIRARLARKDVIAPSLPGFGAPVPDGFDCTKDAYAAWLIAEIEKAGEPVDLVGHDWGSFLAQRIVSLRPALIRTWAAGGAAIDSTYVWHAAAQTWQTPSAGEAMMAAFTPALLEQFFTGEGIPADAAKTAASHVDETMRDSILKLYRSAVTVGAEWEPGLANINRPGLVLWGEKDAYIGPEFARRLSERTGADLLTFDCGHWWPQIYPAEVAAALERHWARAAA